MRTKFKIGELVRLNNDWGKLVGEIMGVRSIKTIECHRQTVDIEYKVMWDGELPTWVGQSKIRKWERISDETDEKEGRR